MEQLVETSPHVRAAREFREIERQRERARHNEASALYNAEQKGMLKVRRKIVKNMYKDGYSVDTIAKVLDLPPKDVKSLLGL